MDRGRPSSGAAVPLERKALSSLVSTVRPPPRPGRWHRAYAIVMRGGGFGLVLQLIVLLCVVVLIVGIAHNVATNLARLGIKTGFWFLSRPAGFDISQTLIPYSDNSTYFTVFVVALLNTLLVSLLSIAVGTLLGFVLALSRSSSNGLVAAAASLYVETFRNIPLLIQLTVLVLRRRAGVTGAGGEFSHRRPDFSQ